MTVRIRETFRHVTLGLMEWQDPPELTRSRKRVKPCLHCGCPIVQTGEGRFPCSFCGKPLPVTERVVYRPWDPQGEVEPFNVQADWEERA